MLNLIKQKLCYIRDNQKVDIALIFAILIGLLTRVLYFQDLPPGLNQDEASTAYDAYSLVNYGIDRNGFSNPVVMVSWGSGMYALAVWLVMPFIYLFGLDVTVYRIPFVLVSLGSLLLFYLFVLKITEKRTARIAVLLLAISPWHIMQSRWGLDSNLYPHVFLLAIYFSLCSFERSWCLIASAAVFALSLYSYGTAYLVTPLSFILLIIYGYRQRKWPTATLISALSVFVILTMPIALFLVVNSFHLPTIITPLVSIPHLSGVARFKTVGNLSLDTQQFITTGINNLKEALNLFLKQDDGLIWNVIPDFGILYLFSIVFFPVGFFIILSRSITRSFDKHVLVLIWLVVSLILMFFLPANINRINIALYPFIFCVAIGLSYLTRSRPIAITILALYSAYFIRFSYYYFKTYQEQAADAFMFGLGEAIKDAAKEESQPICITDKVNMPYIFVLFYLQENPNSFIESVKYVNPGAEFQRVASFGRYYFGVKKCPLITKAYVIKNEELAIFDQSLYEVSRFQGFSVLKRRA